VLPSSAWITGNVFGDWAVQSGWFARAVRILEEAGEDGPERGWVLVMKSLPEPDVGVREAMLREAIAVGRRCADPDVEFEALSYLGGLRRRADRPEQRRLDVLRVLLGVRAGQRRPPRRPVDARRRGPHAAEERRRRLLPCPLRRHPHRRRALERGRDRARRGGQALRPGHAGAARRRHHPARRPACPAGPPRRGHPAAGRPGTASRRRPPARRPPPRPRRVAARTRPARTGHPGPGRPGP
jgi:hypothetical protein